MWFQSSWIFALSWLMVARPLTEMYLPSLGVGVEEGDVAVLLDLFDFAAFVAGEEPDFAIELVGLLGGHGTAVEGAVGVGGGHHGHADVFDEVADLLETFGTAEGLCFAH